jgi:hypothetical protein
MSFLSLSSSYYADDDDEPEVELPTLPVVARWRTESGLSNTLYVRQGDRLPPARALVFTENERVDLTAFESIAFRMVNSEVEIEGVATGTDDGELSYEWADGDTDTLGTYDVVFVGVDADGRELTMPTRDNLKIVISARP